MNSNRGIERRHSRRWALLATLLSLLALLIATRTSGVAHQVAVALPRPPDHPNAVVTPSTPLPSTTIAGLPSRQPDAPVRAVATSPQPLPSIPISAATTTIPRPLSTVAAQLDPTMTETGWLAGPTVVSASYPVNLAAPSSATLTWTGDAVLTLSESCPSMNTSESGTSGLWLQVSAGSCTLRVSGPDAISFTSFRLVVRRSA
jgi:hypothetical protein